MNAQSTQEVCSISGCSKGARKFGLCSHHYRQDLIARDPTFLDRERERNRAYREANSARLLEYDRSRHREKYKQQSHKDALKERHLQKNYGIGLSEFYSMLARQNNKCALCDEEYSDAKRRKFHVDHDHQTGRIRGILCNWCNSFLGSIGDSLEAATRALEYVRKGKRRKQA